MERAPLVRNNVTVAGNVAATKSMVFVNGLGYDQSFWANIAPSFADDHRLVLFDNVGPVQSNQAYFREHQVRYLNVNGYASDLLEICAALNLKADVVVVGHSLGAMAGLLATIRQPSLFSRLVLIGASPRYANAADYVGGFSKEDITQTYTALRKDYSSWSKQLASAALETPDRPSLIKRFVEALLRIPQDMMLTTLCSVLQTDHRGDLAKVSVPTLIIQSQNDYFVPMVVAEYLHAHIAGSQLKLIDAQGHLPHFSAPEQVIPAIAAFLE